MLYASYARGYKAGGFNLDRAQTGITPDGDLWFPPETVDSYELGIKTTLLDNRLSLNVTAFDQRYDPARTARRPAASIAARSSHEETAVRNTRRSHRRPCAGCRSPAGVARAGRSVMGGE